MMTSADAQAPLYVDVCHRSSLLYAFACLVLAEFVKRSVWSPAVNAWATAVTIAFFATAVGTYAVHGALRDTENQLARPHRLGARTLPNAMVALYMGALILGEMGGPRAVRGLYACVLRRVTRSRTAAIRTAPWRLRLSFARAPWHPRPLKRCAARGAG